MQSVLSISEISSFMSMAIALVALIVSFVNLRLIMDQTLTNIENQIRSNIISIKFKQIDIYKEIAILDKNISKETKDKLLLIIEGLDEELLNTYEDFCAKYLDNKIDRKRLKEMYLGEIKNIVTGKFQDHYNLNSKFYCTKEVYEDLVLARSKTRNNKAFFYFVMVIILYITALFDFLVANLNQAL